MIIFLQVVVVFFFTLILVAVLDISRKKRSYSHTVSTTLNQYITYWAAFLLGLFMKRNLVKDCARIEQVQEEVLLKRLQKNAQTEYGKKYGFEKIKSKREFISIHPLTRYDHYKPYVERIGKGETNILTQKKTKLLGVTSGTSGHSSLLPNTAEIGLNFFIYAIPVTYDALFRVYPQMFTLQKILKFFYTPKWRYSEAGIPIGPASSSPSTNKSLLALYSTPLPGFQIMTEPEALYIHLLFGLKDRNICALEANFSGMILAGLNSLKKNWELLVKDIKEGRVNQDLDIPEDVRRDLDNLMKPDPVRGEELQQEFANGFNGIVKRIWPSLHVILTVTTGTAQLYYETLKKEFASDIPVYSPIYGSTEGLIGLNIWPQEERVNYLLVPRSMFCEFIPIDSSDQDQPQTLFMEEVEVGQTYELVITNPSGLYRYRMGDVVKVVKLFHQCPVVEFSYRHGQLLDVRGEKTPESVMYNALQHCLETWGVDLVDYTCCDSLILREDEKIKHGLESKMPFYLVFLEVDGSLSTNETQAADHLDEAICHQSPVYKSFRNKASIESVRLFLVKTGTFQKFREHLLEANPAARNQVKIPRALRKSEQILVMLDNVVKSW